MALLTQILKLINQGVLILQVGIDHFSYTFASF